MSSQQRPKNLSISSEIAITRLISDFERSRGNANTRKSYPDAISVLLDYLSTHGIQDLREVTPQHIQDWVNALESRYSARTVMHRCSAARSFFKRLVKVHGLPVDPTAISRRPKVPLPRPQVVSVDEAAALLEALPAGTVLELRDRAMISLALNAFATTADLIAMDVGDLFLGPSPYVILRGRAGPPMRLPARATLVRHLSEYIELAMLHEESAGPLFRDLRRKSLPPPRRRLEPRSIQAALTKRTREATGGDSVAVRALRGTAIAIFLDSGGTLATAQALARHASIMTTRTYGPEEAVSIEDALNEHLPF